MSDKEVLDFEQSRQSLVEMREQVKQYLRNSSPYDNSFFVLDTDYDHYLMRYTCQEFQVEVNKDGLSRNDIEKLKSKKANDETHGEEFTNK